MSLAITPETIGEFEVTPIDIDEMTTELINKRLVHLANVKSQVQVILPELIERASNTKRDLDKAKSMIQWAKDETTSLQSVLRSMRPSI